MIDSRQKERGMLIEIHGAGFQNKGAELMLRTAVSELRNRIPGVRLAIDPTYGPFSKRSELGLYQIFPYRTHVGTKRFNRLFRVQRLLGFLPRRFLKVYGAAPVTAVDAFIDISGFAYTDQWGALATRNLATLTRYYANRLCPVILLPQALGPFERSENQANFRRVLQNATLIFARDAQSYSYAHELLPDTLTLRQAPDITLFYAATEKAVLKQEVNPYVCIVPNERMLDQGRRDWQDSYEHYLSEMVTMVLTQGMTVKLLVHDTGGEDRRLVQRIFTQTKSEGQVSIVEEQSPESLKRTIGRSQFLIGSRFHSVVAALSQGVPALCLGWAHKYEMLLRDFEMLPLLVTEQSGLESLRVLVSQLSTPEINAQYRRKILDRLQHLKKENERMWRDVTAALQMS
jgi:colanic acid/amylovoran biosynthesis protein